jgi:hypothetical protein
MLGDSTKKKKVYICDTAGIFDTNGIEHQLANGVIMVEAIKSCRSVKIVFVLTPIQVGDGDRFYPLRQHTFKAINSLLVNLSSTITSCYYMLNKYKFAEEFYEMSEKLQKFSEDDFSEVERSDTNFKAFIEDMQQIARVHSEVEDGKSQQRVRFRWSQNVVDVSCNEILKDFESMHPISDPQNSFRHFVSEPAVQALRTQCHAHTNSIAYALARPHPDYALVQYKLDQLRFLLLHYHYMTSVSLATKAALNLWLSTSKLLTRNATTILKQ